MAKTSSVLAAFFGDKLPVEPVPFALGLLRLGTEGRPSEADAIELVHLALDRGIRILDTADSYCLDDKDLHYGERLAKRAIETWNGPSHEVLILTKVGMMRPKGRWVPNGRPEHLRRAVERSCEALGVERLRVCQLHAKDSKVPFEETLAALAELQQEGRIERIGLCNVTPPELRQASRHFAVACIQNELSIVTRKTATDGMLKLVEGLGIPLFAYRPLGGYAKVEKLNKNKVLGPLAERHGTTPHQIALAALREASPNVITLFGATRRESIDHTIASRSVNLDVSDRTALEIKYSFAASPESLTALAMRNAPAPSGDHVTGGGPGTSPEVVIVMGIQGAGKSQYVTEYETAGYARLNRDQLGGRLDDLVPKLAALLANGQNRVVLDNTYPTRVSRMPVIAMAHQYGVPVRCRYLQTPPHEAYFNMATRHLERYGVLLGPDEMKVLAKSDPNLPPPAAMGKWISSLEPPQLDEGFALVETIPFVRRRDPLHTSKGLLLDVDGTIRSTKSGEIYPRNVDDVELLPGRSPTLARWVDAGYQLFFVSNQSGVASGKVARADVESAFLRTAELLRVPVTEVAYCPHPSFPVGCFCRKPMPGMGAYLMRKYQLAPEHLVMVGDMKSDAEFAKSLGAKYYESSDFFGLHGPSPQDDE